MLTLFSLPVAISLIRVSENKISYPGDYVSIYCIFTGNRLEDLHWLKDDKPLQAQRLKFEIHIASTGHYRTKFMGFIYNIGDEDFGEYSCVASNSYGTVKGSISVQGK